MNVELLRKIAAVIQEKPAEFDMGAWHSAVDTGYRKSVDSLCELPPEKREACGTTHCIAGWAQVLSPDRDCKEEAEIDAQRLLNISNDEASRLFYADEWPCGFGRWYATPVQAAARIEHFIETGGRE